MSKVLQHEIGRLECQLLAVGARAEEALRRAVAALVKRDRALAAAVLQDDDEIDRAEVELEEEGLKILALHQPVAVDLRFIVAVLRINSDLERVGDLATTVAKQALALIGAPAVDVPFDVQRMADLSCRMLADSLNALVHLDTRLAERVRAADHDVDARHQDNQRRIIAAIRADAAPTEQYIALLIVSRTLERVADHAKNVAADVSYLVDGAIVRHHRLTTAAATGNGTG